MNIPKIAHWIWLGSGLPLWAQQNIERFQRLHPDWKFRIWQEFPHDFPPELYKIVQSLPWYSSRSDIFSYWLLKTFGGVYLDTDIVPLKNFDSLLSHHFFLAPCTPEGHVKAHLNCALMGSKQNSEIACRILDECLKVFEKTPDPVRTSYGPKLLTELFERKMPNLSILPFHYFYSIPDKATAHKFWLSDSSLQEDILAPIRPQFEDEEEPFALHLWGVDNSSHKRADSQL